MSLTGDRDQIAAALSTVSGITGYATRPTAIKQGDAWPRFNGAERGPGQTLMASWVVSLVLGSDEELSIQRTDSWIHLILDALRPVGFVTGFSPVVYGTQAGDLFGLEIRMDSE